MHLSNITGPWMVVFSSRGTTSRLWYHLKSTLEEIKYSMTKITMIIIYKNIIKLLTWLSAQSCFRMSTEWQINCLTVTIYLSEGLGRVNNDLLVGGVLFHYWGNEGWYRCPSRNICLTWSCSNLTSYSHLHK